MTHFFKISLILLLAFFVSCEQDIFTNEHSTKVHLRSHLDTVSYSLGIVIAKNLKQKGIKKVDLPVMMAAMQQVLNGSNDTLLVDPVVAEQILKIYLYKELKQNPQIVNQQWKQFMDENAKRRGVKILSSGLQYEILEHGRGIRPRLTDYVEVRYKGYLPDGTVFDNNYLRSPAVFRVANAIEGWQQALLRMREGDKWRIYLPPYLAFGNRQVGKIPPNSVVIYEIKLLKVKHIK